MFYEKLKIAQSVLKVSQYRGIEKIVRTRKLDLRFCLDTGKENYISGYTIVLK